MDIKELIKLPYVSIEGDVVAKPLTEIPRTPTKLVSPRVGKSHGLEAFDKSTIWDQACEINELVQKVKNGEFPWEYLSFHYPKEWGKLSRKIPEPLKGLGITESDPKSLAYSVQMDQIPQFGLAIMDYLSMKGLRPVHLLTYKHVPFLGINAHGNEDLGDYTKKALEKAFDEKYLHVIPRPEQVWEAVTGLPRKDFGIYPAPSHPAYPAGHSCNFAATLKFFVDKYKLGGNELTVAREATYLGAMGRNMAGVHYTADSLAGFKLLNLI